MESNNFLFNKPLLMVAIVAKSSECLTISICLVLKFGFRTYLKCNMSQLGNFCENVLWRRVLILVWNKHFIIGLLRTHFDCLEPVICIFFLKLHFNTFIFESWILNSESSDHNHGIFVKKLHKRNTWF